MLDYTPMFDMLKTKGLTKSDLSTSVGISSRTIAKFSKGEQVANRVLVRISEFLGCEVKALYRIVASNPILQRLRDEKDSGFHGGLYHEIQIRMAYNSNHIEGSCLSEEQTRMIFETRTVLAEEGVPVDDIIEANNHFKAFDYCIECAEEPLSEDQIKRLHYLLKRNTSYENKFHYAVGEYKTIENTVGGMETTRPSDVKKEMKDLLAWYSAKKEKNLETIVDFHVRFERIHPFQDGNGRVGRLVAFKECLKNNITPFIIEDQKKLFYYRGLSQWGHVNEFLFETCRDAQELLRPSSHLI